MNKQQPISAAVCAIVATLIVANAGALLANGQLFFMPAGRGPVELVYFARVKDARTGRPIQVTPHVTIVDPFTGIYTPFEGDGPGHFRSPDIGAAIKEVTTQPIDPRQLEIMVIASGYETVKVASASIPRQAKGAVELNVRMEPKASADNASAGPTTTTASRSVAPGAGGSVPTDSSKPTFFLLAACFGLAAISAVARTVGRPASTGR